jgi:hypothetical protein
VSSERPISLDELLVAARFDRDRLALYRARALTGKPFSPTRMRELERAAESSLQRLQRASQDAPAPPI